MTTTSTPAPSVVPVGGTSGTGANTLGLNLGGINLTYDLGPSLSTIASQSAAFLNNSWNNDAAFVGSAIVGANNLVSGLTEPLIQGAQDQMTFDNAQLPQMYTNLMDQNYQLGIGSINAEQQVAKASIQSSESAAQSAGGCYITTAVCDTLGLPDDCHTLKTLREFRDTYMMRSAKGRAYVREYYETAPALCDKIHNRTDARTYLEGLYTRFILPALLNIGWKNPEGAFKIYRRMIYTIRQENP
jgi:hypothetical protein